MRLCRWAVHTSCVTYGSGSHTHAHTVSRTRGLSLQTAACLIFHDFLAWRTEPTGPRRLWTFCGTQKGGSRFRDCNGVLGVIKPLSRTKRAIGCVVGRRRRGLWWAWDVVASFASSAVASSVGKRGSIPAREPHDQAFPRNIPPRAVPPRTSIARGGTTVIDEASSGRVCVRR